MKEEVLQRVIHWTNRENMMINPQKTIFWCGAGISTLEPSNLPLGKSLVDFVLEELLDKKFVEELYIKLKRVDAVLMSRNLELGNCLRLESVISEISQIEHSLKPEYHKQLLFTEALKSFKEAPYNLNHDIISRFVMRGSMVVTTNYDICIEKAVEANSGHEICLKSKNIDGIYEYNFGKENYGSIYHIHGTAEDPQNIGITYQTVSRKFPDSFQNMLNTWLEEGYTFIFLGYSCGDNYDVEKYFEELYQKNIDVNSNVLFVQHGYGNEQQELSASVIKHLSVFKNIYAITINTNEFLQKLISSYKIQFENQSEQQDSFCWKKRMREKIVISEELQGLFFLKMCRLVGMNPQSFSFEKEKMEAFKKMVALKDYPVQDFIIELTLLYTNKEQWNASVCKKIVESGSEEYNSKYNTTFFYPSRRQYDLNDVLEIERKYDELEKKLPTLYELGQGLHRLKADKKRIGWEISTPLHKHTKILLHKMKNEVVKNNINFLSKEYRIIIRKQLELIDNILELDFEKYEEINQYCVALRSKAILIVFLFGEKRYGEIIRHLSKAIEIYLKESSIDGIVSCIYLSSTIYFLLYLQTRKYYYLVYSTKALNDVGKMVNICMSGKLAEYIKEEKLWKESCLKLKK